MWTTEQVLALAPDPASASAGKGLSTPAKWVELGAADGVIWGLCRGSGKDPYKARISLAEPAFKCTCPSRKFPCKHSIGLFLIHAQDPGKFKRGEIPAWVAEWLGARETRAAKKVEKAEAARDAPPDPEARAKRAARREGNVNDGIELLAQWLNDLVRQGLAHAQSQPSGFWETMAARMVDAQAPGLARRVREMSAIPHSGAGWHERMLHRAGALHLLITAWGRIAELDEALREDVRAAIGFTHSRDEVLATAGVADTWHVASQRIEQEPDGLRVQRLWLLGEQSRRTALVLSFSHRSAPAFDVNFPTGARMEGEVAFYPSAYPQRALVKHGRIAESGSASDEAACSGCLSGMMNEYAAALSAQPWIESFPAMLEGVCPVAESGRWLLRDKNNAAVPIRLPEESAWQLIALCGGRPSRLFGEWNGEVFAPLSARTANGFVSLAG